MREKHTDQLSLFHKRGANALTLSISTATVTVNTLALSVATAAVIVKTLILSVVTATIIVNTFTLSVTDATVIVNNLRLCITTEPDCQHVNTKHLSTALKPLLSTR